MIIYRKGNILMKLLNSKSILDCTENDIEMHNQEINSIIGSLQKYDNYDCAIIYKYFDQANKDKKPIIKQCKLYDCLDTIQYADIKNGVDLSMIEGFLTFICYGTEYQYNNQNYVTTIGIQIRPYDNNRIFTHLNF